MVDYKPNMVLSNQEYKVVGTRPVRPDGLDKATGRARYGADFKISGLLYGRVLRSPHAHARINSIDISMMIIFFLFKKTPIIPIEKITALNVK